MEFQIKLGDVVEMKKPHPCASRCSEFTIVRVGADIKIQCKGCGNIMMLPREVFNKKCKRILE